jgi:hypothetical protein
MAGRPIPKAPTARRRTAAGKFLTSFSWQVGGDSSDLPRFFIPILPPAVFSSFLASLLSRISLMALILRMFFVNESAQSA